MKKQRKYLNKQMTSNIKLPNEEVKKILRENFNITNITTHSLRHTYGTRCVEAGMRAVALQRLMGHTDVGITSNTYTSVFNQYKQAELQKENDYYMNHSLLEMNKLLKLTDCEKENER